MAAITQKRKFERRFPPKTNTYPAQLGDGLGNLFVPNQSSCNFVRMGGTVQIIFNNRVPAEYDKLVNVGYIDGLFQVISTRTTQPGGSNNQGGSGYAPAARYEYLAPGGGQDPLKVQLRQFMPHRIGAYAGLIIQVNGGMARNGTNFLWAVTEVMDLAAHIPSTVGKAALVLIVVNSSGVHVAIKGNEFTLADVTTDNEMLSNLPAIPTGSIKLCGAVRAYYGQSMFQEARTNTDFIDLRFAFDLLQIPGSSTALSDLSDVDFSTPPTNGQIIKYDSVSHTWLPANESGGGGGGAEDYILIRDEKSSGTPGGTFTASGWRTRDLNTIISDIGNHATLATNQITLGAGTYRYQISAPAYYVNRHQVRLYDVSNSAVITNSEGSSEYNLTEVQTRSFTTGKFTLTGTTILEIQHYCTGGLATYGFGVPGGFGKEIYTIAEFWKEN
jgi:hypothetical protein